MALTKKQYGRISNIFDNLGGIIFGVAVLSPIITGFDKINSLVVIWGIVSSIDCWIISILLARRG